MGAVPASRVRRRGDAASAATATERMTPVIRIFTVSRQSETQILPIPSAAAAVAKWQRGRVASASAVTLSAAPGSSIGGRIGSACGGGGERGVAGR